MKYKYILTTIIAIALFSTIVYANPGDNPGQIIDNPWAHLYTTTPTTETTTEVETTTSDGFYDVSEYKSTTPYTYPTMEGKVFAGWYTDSTCETKYYENTGRAYAKFVDDKVLTVKFQRKTDDGTAIRFLSTVDCLDYQSVGFIFYGTYGSATISEKERSTNTVYMSINAAGQTTLPTVFSPESNYFFTWRIGGLNPQTSMTWNAKAFWVTHDGTKVIGPDRDYSYTPNN